MFDFKNQVIIVTGAAGALGHTVASSFLQAQARLILVDLHLETLHAAFPQLINNPDVLFCPANLTDPDSVQNMLEQSVNKFSQIDVIANIAGGFRMGPKVHETPLADWDFMMDLNAKSVFLTSRVVVPQMLSQGHGKIINVAARAAVAGKGKMAPYIASKSAVMRLTESLSAELKADNINVNCILPGTVDTPTNRADMPDADYSQWVPTEDLANAILFLASDAARGVHGAALPVYGLS